MKNIFPPAARRIADRAGNAVKKSFLTAVFWAIGSKNSPYILTAAYLAAIIGIPLVGCALGVREIPAWLGISGALAIVGAVLLQLVAIVYQLGLQSRSGGRSPYDPHRN